jgi:hypothetical protein
MTKCDIYVHAHRHFLSGSDREFQTLPNRESRAVASGAGESADTRDLRVAHNNCFVLCDKIEGIDGRQQIIWDKSSAQLQGAPPEV